MRQRGFLAFLLGNPLMLACAALGVALIIAGLGLKYYKSRAEHWQAEYQTEKAAYAGFVEAVKRQGEAQEKATAEKEEKDRATTKAIVATLKADLARRDADLKRLRDRPPADPGGREVPVLACGPPGTDGAAEKLVPLTEYRALEERSYDDALRLTRLQEWVKATGHPAE